MKDNRFQQVVASGKVPVGHMIWEFGTRGIARLAATADLDFCIIDMEHTGFDTERVADLLAWFRGTEIAPFVRIPQPQYHFLARVMDAGALGVMVPNVQSAEEARGVRDAVKYAPLGKRGVGIGGAQNDFVAPDPVRYFERSNRNTTVICQIESITGVENANDIATVDGVDTLWVGHFDLTQSMGIPGQFDDPRFLQALDIVVEAAAKNGKTAGIQPGNMAQAEKWIDCGFNVISWTSDYQVYRRALQTEVTALRKKLGQ